MASNVAIEFEHAHAAHCESGTFAALLRHHGLRLSEPLVFGIGSGLFFLHVPFIRLYDVPITAYRDLPNAIIGRAARRLGVRLRRQRFRNSGSAMRALDRLLDARQPVGMQTGVFWLGYFPRDMRFQFNGHHVIAYGRDGGDYLLSDTVFESTVRCPAEQLERARFSKGPLAPRGLQYVVESIAPSPDIAGAVRAGLRTTLYRMLRIPLPYMGIRGMHGLAAAIERWPDRLEAPQFRAQLAMIIRMQEEIGTGGAGFRFMFAAFLAEAATLLEAPFLQEASERFSEIGDRWRDFAVRGAQLLRDPAVSASGCRELANLVRECAAAEASAFRAIAAKL